MLELPDYPWNQLAPYRELAAEHPDGVVDLSIGTPVDDTPQVIQQALAEAANSHGYPTTHGTPAVRQAIVDWYARRRNVTGLGIDDVMPTVGSKELVAWLPLLLGMGAEDILVRPKIAYPTYDIGARLVGATAIAADDLSELTEAERARVKLVWVNSPGNPTGKVRDVESLRQLVAEARELGAVVASDECYAELGWDEFDGQVPSVLDPRVNGGNLDNLLSLYSLSKQSNLAGYRAAFVAGAPNLMPALVNSRKHAGMIVPGPIQHAMVIALGDDAHVAAQRELYRARREALRPALENFGLTIEDSVAGLYLWCTEGRSSWQTLQRLAELGIVAGPGAFYGTAGQSHVRVALTGSDERIATAVERLNSSAAR
ncbi:succinyldiaminopimelate transaminase [Arthrobacter sp. MYb211]|uniref:succinyldiaminopimelate transaminase n=1 Tax=unclassified Arthrobacter TaxID=235627 RepID=UPI000CFD55DA|nr:MULTISPECIES: succinyldiaminopimelate transaminase [unclassified Arthrobacter]PRA12823.1 succinyldiaminopimelate transaminase [Arthrobacter sp. MYb221]PRC09657.1 succinyldiaminopimelate transaminase [Arthrobacter sp. MYb211]